MLNIEKFLANSFMNHIWQLPWTVSKSIDLQSLQLQIPSLFFKMSCILAPVEG